MLKIGDLFKRISSKYAKEIYLRTLVAETINRHAKTDLKDTDISINSTIVTLDKVTASAKNTIFIKKTKILQDLNTEQAIRKITDIK